MLALEAHVPARQGQIGLTLLPQVSRSPNLMLMMLIDRVKGDLYAAGQGCVTQHLR